MPPTSQNQIIIDLKSVVTSLKDDLNKVKVQTGELVSARQQIAEIDRALRGHDGQRGLMERFGLIEQAMDHLIKIQIPALVDVVKTSAKTELEIHQAQQALEYERIKTDIDKLRLDYQIYVTQTGKEQEKEAKEETGFGGREWFRQNAAGILIAVITALVMIAASGIVNRIVETMK